MTDSEMKKVFENLKKENLSDAELAISMLVAIGMARNIEVQKATTVHSER